MLFASAPTWSGVTSWVPLLLAIAVAWRLSRGGSGTAVQELSKANDVLTESLAKARAEIVELKGRISILERRTDIVAAVQPMLDAHETRAQERHESSLHLLEALVTEVKKP